MSVPARPPLTPVGSALAGALGAVFANAYVQITPVSFYTSSRYGATGTNREYERSGRTVGLGSLTPSEPYIPSTLSKSAFKLYQPGRHPMRPLVSLKRSDRREYTEYHRRHWYMSCSNG